MTEDIDRLPACYRAGNKVVTQAYEVGVEDGRKLGRDEHAREHHQWLLSHDERLAEVAAEARREALLDAAEAWENLDSTKIAEQHYRAGGPSLPTIWLKLRAEESR